METHFDDANDAILVLLQKWFIWYTELGAFVCQNTRKIQQKEHVIYYGTLLLL